MASSPALGVIWAAAPKAKKWLSNIASKRILFRGWLDIIGLVKDNLIWIARNSPEIRFLTFIINPQSRVYAKGRSISGVVLHSRTIIPHQLKKATIN